MDSTVALYLAPFFPHFPTTSESTEISSNSSTGSSREIGTSSVDWSSHQRTVKRSRKKQSIRRGVALVEPVI